MKKLAIALSLFLCTGALVAAENHGSCDMAKDHHAANGKMCDMQKGKTASMTGQIFTKDNARYFKVADSGKSYPICEHSSAKLDELGDNVNVKVKARVIDCADHKGQETLFIEKADKI